MTVVDQSEATLSQKFLSVFLSGVIKNVKKFEMLLKTAFWSSHNFLNNPLIHLVITDMSHRATGEKLHIEQKFTPVFVSKNSALEVDFFPFWTIFRLQFGQRRDHEFFSWHPICVVLIMYNQDQKKKVWVFCCKNAIERFENGIKCQIPLCRPF